jgi:hypothetical protein
MGFYLVIKKNEIMLFAGKWMELESISLSEISQEKKRRMGHECKGETLWQKEPVRGEEGKGKGTVSVKMIEVYYI